ncbi:hypothetical protein GF323_03785 [Candidatus Woesearchaeota archaeon]|nr:hypothetical protein [Candidatus Woesearchaeota archaeon]
MKRLELLLETSADKIIPYVFIERRNNNGEKELREKSELERITSKLIAGKKGRLHSRKRAVPLESIEKRASLEEPETPEASYELFMPVSGLGKYDAIEIRYSKRDSESVEIGMRRGGEEAGLKLEKPLEDKENYSILFLYDKSRKGYKVRYDTAYKDKLELARQDFTNRLDKALEILPKSLMGGVLGFTYLGSGKMARRG